MMSPMVQFEYDLTEISPVPVEHLSRIGELAVSAARLEYVMATLAWELIDEDETVGMAVTAGMSFERLNRLVGSLAEKRLAVDSHALNEYRSVTRLANDAMNERNRLLHGHWRKEWHEPAGQDPHLVTRTRQGAIAVRMHVTAEEIREVTGRLIAASRILQLAQYQLWSELGRLEEASPGLWTRRQNDAPQQ
jgi:hypothetical protein